MEVLDTSIANVALVPTSQALSAPAGKKPPEALTSYLVSRRHPFFPSPAGSPQTALPGRKRFLHDLRGALHRLLHALRLRPHAADPHHRAHPPGRGWRRPRAQRTSHPRRHLPHREKRGQSASPSTAWPSLSPPPSATRRWAVGSPTTSTGIGSFLSTCQSAFFLSFSATGWSKTLRS